LAQIVSSGEAARVMLALKKSPDQSRPHSVLIFDESTPNRGRLGTITGQEIKKSFKEQASHFDHPTCRRSLRLRDRHFKVVNPSKAAARSPSHPSGQRQTGGRNAQMMAGRTQLHLHLPRPGHAATAQRKR